MPSGEAHGVRVRATLPDHRADSVVLTLGQCIQVIRWWCDRLGLGEWQIDCAILRSFEMDDCQALLGWQHCKLSAVVKLLDPMDHGMAESPIDMEQSIVHELLHLRFVDWLEWSKEKGLANDFVQSVTLEQPTERLSWVLVNMRRESATNAFPWEKSGVA